MLLRLARKSRAYWGDTNFRYLRRKKKKKIDGRTMRPRTKSGRDAAVARHRALIKSRNPVTRRTIEEVIAGLSAPERAAIAGNKHAISAIEKILEAMLFRFSA